MFICKYEYHHLSWEEGEDIVSFLLIKISGDGKYSLTKCSYWNDCLIIFSLNIPSQNNKIVLRSLSDRHLNEMCERVIIISICDRPYHFIPPDSLHSYWSISTPIHWRGLKELYSIISSIGCYTEVNWNRIDITLLLVIPFNHSYHNSVSTNYYLKCKINLIIV